MTDISKKTEVSSVIEQIHDFVMERGNRYVIMMIGLSGSGKTQWARKYDKKYPECVRLSSDYFIEREAIRMNLDYREVYAFFIKKAVKFFHMSKEIAIENGESVIIDRMNISVEGRRILLECFEGYTKVGLIFKTQHVDKFGLDYRLEPISETENFDLIVEVD